MIIDLKSQIASSSVIKSSKKEKISPEEWFREQMERYQSKPHELGPPDWSLKGRYRSADGIVGGICRLLDDFMQRYAVDIDFSQDSLKDSIDKLDMEFMLNEWKEEKIKHKPLLGLIGVAESVGGYFGEVIVRNLGGEWNFPRWWRFSISEIVGRPGIYFDHFYVIHKGNKIPVLKIVRWRFDGSGRVKSLYEVYKEIEATGNWSGSGKNRLSEFLEESKTLRKWVKMKGIR